MDYLLSLPLPFGIASHLQFDQVLGAISVTASPRPSCSRAAAYMLRCKWNFPIRPWVNHQPLVGSLIKGTQLSLSAFPKADQQMKGKTEFGTRTQRVLTREEDCCALEPPFPPFACLSIWDSERRMDSRVKALWGHVVSLNWSISSRNANFLLPFSSFFFLGMSTFKDPGRESRTSQFFMENSRSAERWERGCNLSLWLLGS